MLVEYLCITILLFIKSRDFHISDMRDKSEVHLSDTSSFFPLSVPLFTIFYYYSIILILQRIVTVPINTLKTLFLI